MTIEAYVNGVKYELLDIDYNTTPKVPEIPGIGLAGNDYFYEQQEPEGAPGTKSWSFGVIELGPKTEQTES
jgi:hypothetical protein